MLADPRFAPQPRRPGGWLKAQILTMLDQAERPITGQQLARKLNEEAVPVHHSAVFRTLNQMMVEGALARVELASAYLIGSPVLLYLVCTKCGGVTGQEAHEPAAALNCMSAKLGFAATRMILEVAGLCRSCRQGDHVGTGELDAND